MTVEQNADRSSQDGITLAGSLDAHSAATVKVLYLFGERPTASEWLTLRLLTALEEMHINDSKIVQEDFSTIACFKELRILQASGIQVGTSGINALQTCLKLETLILGRFKFPGSLKWVVPEEPCILKFEPTSLVRFPPFLKQLDVSAVQLPEGFVSSLVDLPRLETLDLRGTNVDDRDLERLSSIKTLCRLRLRDDPKPIRLNDPGFGFLTSQVTSAAVIRFMEAIPTCDVDYHFDWLVARLVQSDDRMELMRSLGRLRNDDTYLILAHSGATDLSIPYLKNLESIRRVSLDFCDISDVGLRQIATIPHLSELYLRRTSVTAAGLKSLGMCTDLRVLVIEAAVMKQAEFHDAFKAIPQVELIGVFAANDEERIVLSQIAEALDSKRFVIGP